MIYLVAELREGGICINNIGEVQNIARQNHVRGKVALMRGAWVYDDWRIPDLLETYAQEMMSRKRGL